ncbi:hypothetical protein BCR34DRAFT_24467 [Clohesyomyces aquaticus]|uniref:Uncharacterized protein n=1 Tax=Clohesyomyces aquaticus TaxID=1231657 RepID=A0A1Y2A6K7_9PLEO|nr:hypothetical protein BCR34DRAFT_24467 [Clohesyomyces aquaticus]
MPSLHAVGNVITCSHACRALPAQSAGTSTLPPRDPPSPHTSSSHQRGGCRANPAPRDLSSLGSNLLFSNTASPLTTPLPAPSSAFSLHLYVPFGRAASNPTPQHQLSPAARPSNACVAATECTHDPIAYSGPPFADLIAAISSRDTPDHTVCLLPFCAPRSHCASNVDPLPRLRAASIGFQRATVPELFSSFRVRSPIPNSPSGCLSTSRLQMRG